MTSDGISAARCRASPATGRSGGQFPGSGRRPLPLRVVDPTQKVHQATGVNAEGQRGSWVWTWAPARTAPSGWPSCGALELVNLRCSRLQELPSAVFAGASWQRCPHPHGPAHPRRPNPVWAPCRCTIYRLSPAEVHGQDRPRGTTPGALCPVAERMPRRTSWSQWPTGSKLWSNNPQERLPSPDRGGHLPHGRLAATRRMGQPAAIPNAAGEACRRAGQRPDQHQKG